MAYAVVLRRPDTDELVSLLPGQECPAWAERVITNSGVFVDEPKADRPEGKRRAHRSKSDD